MSYEVLEKKLKIIPEQYFEQVSSFLDLLLSLPKSAPTETTGRKPSGHPISGLAKGKFKYPDDINLYDDEIAEMFGV